VAGIEQPAGLEDARRRQGGDVGADQHDRAGVGRVRALGGRGHADAEVAMHLREDGVGRVEQGPYVGDRVGRVDRDVH